MTHTHPSILLQILVHFIQFISFPLLIISQNTTAKTRKTNLPKNAKTKHHHFVAFLRSVSGCNQPTNQPTSLEAESRRLSSGWRPPQLEATNCRTRNLKRPNLMTSNGGSAPGRFGDCHTRGCWVVMFGRKIDQKKVSL